MTVAPSYLSSVTEVNHAYGHGTPDAARTAHTDFLPDGDEEALLPRLAVQLRHDLHARRQAAVGGELAMQRGGEAAHLDLLTAAEEVLHRHPRDTRHF
jgi:hypothetical protein